MGALRVAHEVLGYQGAQVFAIGVEFDAQDLPDAGEGAGEGQDAFAHAETAIRQGRSRSQVADGLRRIGPEAQALVEMLSILPVMMVQRSGWAKVKSSLS
jgi:hypothetical protein